MAFLPGPSNFVNYILTTNCNRPFYIYVQTFIPAFFDAWLMYRWFDFDDIVRERGKYLATRGAPTGRGGRHTKKVRGKAVPQARERYSSRDSLRHFMAWTHPLEMIGLALLLYGVVNQFYYDWQYYLDLADACIDPGFHGPLQRRVIDGQAFPNSEGNSLQLPILVQNSAGWLSGNISADLPIGKYNVTFAATVIGPKGGGANYGLGIRSVRGLSLGGANHAANFCPEGEETDLVENWEVIITSVLGGTISWVIHGPGVPVGLRIPKARIAVWRQTEFFTTSNLKGPNNAPIVIEG